MRKKVFEKRKKFTTNTYMRECIDYDISILKENDLCITIKKYNKMENTVSFESKTEGLIKYLDKGHFIVEITPLNELYNLRYFLDDKLNIIECYIDITYKNGIENKIPYYVDLYLDITYNPRTKESHFMDEDELLEALNKKIISKKDYNLALKIGNKLKDNLESNKYFNIDIISYIKKYYR